MKKPNAETRCRACKKRFENHRGGKCPEGTGMFVGRSQKRSSASISEQEVAWMDEVIRTLLRGGQPAKFVARPECEAIAAKLTVMKAGIERNKQRLDKLAEAK